MSKVEMIDDWEQTKYKADQIIQNILLHANFFEQTMRAKPTIFVSYDIFAILAAGTRDLLLYRVEQNKPISTICGYDLEIIHQGSELLYIGYKVL
jgi:hypothetical protein